MATLFDKWTFEGSSLLGEEGCRLNVYRNPTFSMDKVKDQVKTIATFGSQNGFISAQRFTDNTNVTAICAFRLNADSIYTVHYECQVLGITNGTYLGSAITVSNGNKIGVGYYGTGHVLVPSNVSIQKGKWYIIAYRKTGNVIDVFLDGQLIHTVTAHSTHAGAPFLTGQYCNSSGIHSKVNRSYVELQVYEDTLSDQEIRILSEGIKNKSLILHEGKYKRWNEEVPAEPEVWSDDKINLVTKMTSNSSGGQLAFWTYNTDKPGAGIAYNAFDYATGGENTGISRRSGSGIVGIIFPKEVTVARYEIEAHNIAKYAPRIFTIEGSNDTTSGLDGTWTTLDSRTGIFFTQYEKKSFELSESSTFKALRLNTVATNDTITGFAELRFFPPKLLLEEYKPKIPAHWSEIVTIPSTVKEVLEIGMESLSTLLNRSAIETDWITMMKRE
ncbi:LamG-like jellyroll fold domain-containing protein [Lysinibacillus sp. FSL R7-0073]|uniref:LamG-like jellyroll fold domain-containing protein n=1 Tax=Lysinibacillus TaxID=400634 RepID=UPI002E235887|nr:hypothetical protein [Lysinibacillus fusiformis]